MTNKSAPKSARSTLERLSTYPWAAETLALLAGVCYTWQLWSYSHTRESVLDEGLYLYKGYLFATGQYQPYQLYGTWSNHMPLSFLIPGYVQRLFGPGLTTGRYFAILVAVLALLGFWIVARRLGGRWWAAAAAWALALNPALVKMYSVAVSQGLIACMLVWMLVLTLGEERPPWQVYLGALLSGVMVMTRINMLPILPLFVIYVCWQHGFKRGATTALLGLLPIAIGHVLFWPNILQMWAAWLPRALTPFLDTWRLPASYARLWDPEVTLSSRVLSFFHAARFHFLATLGVLSALLLWPRPERWKSQNDFRNVVYLCSLFLSLLLLHMWATLTKNYCVFCLEGYMAFFSPIGLLIIIASFSAWCQRPSWWRQVAIALLIVALSTGIGFAAFEEIGSPLLERRVPATLLTFPRFSPGSIPLGKVLDIRYELDYLSQRWLVSSLAGALAGLLVLALASGVYWLARRRLPPRSAAAAPRPPGFAYWALVVLLVASALLSPNFLLGGGQTAYDCAGDTIQSYRQAGEHLARLIPPGSLIYWKGGLSVVPLLYIPGARIFPPQLNGDYSYYHLPSDPDTLLKLGFWNETLNHQWARQADYILIQERYYNRWIKTANNPGVFDELEPTPPTAECYLGARILVFKRRE